MSCRVTLSHDYNHDRHMIDDERFRSLWQQRSENTVYRVHAPRMIHKCAMRFTIELLWPRADPSSSVKFQGRPSQNAAHSFFSSNPSPHLIGRTGDTAVREAQMPSTAPSQHVAICSLTRRVLRCASEVTSIQSARSSACNQLDAARLALHERGHQHAISFHRWQSACTTHLCA